MTTENMEQKVRDLFEKAGFSVEHISSHLDEVVGTILITVEISDQKMFLGAYGNPLQAVNQIVRKQLEQEFPGQDISNFIIDIGGIYARKIETLKNKAKIIAERSRSFKRDIELEPMSGFDRLIIHSVLATVPYVRTESRGVGRDRKVTIYYIEPEKDTHKDF